MTEIPARDLSQALRRAAEVVEARGTIPILSHVLLRAGKAGLAVTATDLDCEFSTSLAVKAGKSFALTVDARRIAAIAAAAGDDAAIRLEPDGARLTIRAGRGRWQLPTLPAEDFPALSADLGTPAGRLECPAVEFSQALARAEWSVSTEETRYYLNGVFFDPEEDKLRLTATNGHTLACVTTAFDWPEGAPEIILPKKAVRLLIRMLDTAKPVTIEWDQRKVKFTLGESAFITKTIDGTFPDYRRVIPPERENPLRFDPTSARGALRQVGLVYSGKTRAVAFSGKDNALLFAVTDPEGGTASAELPGDCAGSFSSGFNANYLSGALEMIGGETVELHQADAGSPALLRRVPGDGALAVVMPMRV